MISIPDFNKNAELAGLLGALRGGMPKSAQGKADIERIIGSSVPADILQQAKAVLSDDKKVRALLESEAARELLKKLNGGGGNG